MATGPLLALIRTGGGEGGRGADLADFRVLN